MLLLAGLLPVLACNLPVNALPGSGGAAHPMVTAHPPLDAEAEAGQAQTPAAGLPIVTMVGTGAVNPDAVNAAQGQIVTPFPIPASASRLVGNTFYYVSQSGDTLAALALRFGVTLDQVPDPPRTAPQAFLPVGQQISFPNTLKYFDTGGPLLPDGEVIYSPSTLDFSVENYVRQAGGYLSTYKENVDGDMLTGAQIVQRAANETSINPRLLLAVLDYRSHWVNGPATDAHATPYPVGFAAAGYAGLYKEMILTARELTLGYYGWRSGKLVTLTFLDRTTRRMNPMINPGTAALQTLFAVLNNPADWQAQLYAPASFLAYYGKWMGDPWSRAEAAGPILPDGLEQPPLELPFAPGVSWSFSGGPHAAYGVGSPWGALDFAPATKNCEVSPYWATAVASGEVVRSGNAQVVVDLDGDGREQTGWDILYLHIASTGRIQNGAKVGLNDSIGHPSCEGGVSTGTHVHISRKYNGEWLAADGALPFVISGWQAQAGDYPYTGALAKGTQLVTARPDGDHTSLISR